MHGIGILKISGTDMASDVLEDNVKNGTIWYAKDMQSNQAWLNPLSTEQQKEITVAFQTAKKNAATSKSIKKADFPLPQLGNVINKMQHGIDKGYGFSVIRGVPIAGLNIDDIELIYSGITAHFGVKINQDTKGTLIDHVSDRGSDYSDISVRGYTTNAQLTPHCDSGDLISLMCVNPAKEGGMNNISCSMAIYNEILNNNPEYLDSLYRGYHYNIRGNGPLGKYQDITAHRVPVFSYYESMLSCRYNEKAIYTAEELSGAPPLSDLDKKAIRMVSELAHREDIQFNVMLEAGDIAFLNNYTVLHNRGPFVDHSTPEKRRLYLRQWINLHNGRLLKDEFADHYNTGPRKGPAIHINTGE